MTRGVSRDDATIVDPDHYTVEFENDRVRVVRIRYGPNERSAAMHSHRAGVRVFLTDVHAGARSPDGAAGELRVPAGTVDWIPPTRHLPENLESSPFELVLIELKGPDPTPSDEVRPDRSGHEETDE